MYAGGGKAESAVDRLGVECIRVLELEHLLVLLVDHRLLLLQVRIQLLALLKELLVLLGDGHELLHLGILLHLLLHLLLVP